LVRAWNALYPSANRIDLDYLHFFERNTVLNSKNAIVNADLPNQYPNLDIEDITSIHHYTDDFYAELNSALRSGNLDPHLTGFAKALNNGLEKLPNFSGTTYRGTTIPESVVMSKYKTAFDNNQANIVEEAFTSTSTSPNVANSFANDVLDPGDVRVFFSMTSSKGKDVDAFSKYGPNFTNPAYSESEVLFKSGESFSVKNFEDTVDINGNRIILITLEN